MRTADLLRGRLAGTLSAADWFERAGPDTSMRTELMRLCAYYLQQAKLNGEPADAVARFHLGNGARMDRLNWLADSSKTGMARSAGLMVNYVYRLKDVERNHEIYANKHVVVASPGLALLARESLMARLGAKGKA